MKYILPSLIAIYLFFQSCSSTNRIYVKQDDFKNHTTIKMNQSLKGFSDETRKGLAKFADYYITFKHYYATDSNEASNYRLDVKISTTVRAYEIEPILYISVDDKKYQLEAKETITKMYQEGSSSTSSETSASTTEDESGEEETETTTTYTTSTSHNTYQLMQLSFNPDIELLKEIARSKRTTFRLYIKNEVIDVPLKKRNRRKFEKYITLISED